MPEGESMEALASEIRQRLDAVDEKVSEQTSDETLAERIRELLPDLLSENSDTVKEMLREQQQTPRELVGSKYARAGLSVADVEFLHDIQSGLQGQRTVGEESGSTHPGPSEELQRTYEAISEGRVLDVAVARHQDEKRVEEIFAHRNDHAGFERAMQAIRAGAMDTSESGYGSELTGQQYVADLWEGVRAQSRIFNTIPTFEMTDPTAFLPVEADVPEMLFVSENTGDSDSNYTTSKTGSNRVQVDAKKFVIHQMWSGEMEEDSLIPFIPFLREQAARSLAHYSDSVVLNGDATNSATGNINLDDADPTDTKHYLAFDGIRHVGLVDNTANQSDVGGAISLNAFKNQRGRMVDTTHLHDWSHPTDMDDLVYVADPETVDAIAFLDEVITVDKYGPRATVLTGEQGRVLGHPLISSQAMSKTEADGKVSTTSSNNTKGQVVAYNRRGYTAGWRRRVRIETERLPATDQTRLVYSLRMGFGRFTPTGSASGIESSDALFNITL